MDGNRIEEILKTTLQDFKEEINQRFSEINSRFDGVEKHLQGIDQKLDRLDDKTDKILEYSENIDKGVEEVRGEMYKKANVIDLMALDQRVKSLEEKLS